MIPLRDAGGRFKQVPRVKRKRNYHLARKRLILEMGGKCHYCPRVRKLEFHHIKRKEWTSNRTSRWVRLARCRREWLEGKVVLACSKCNKLQGQPPPDEEDLRQWIEWMEGKHADEVPF